MSSYEDWLEETQAELQEAIRECENEGYHHMEEGTLEARTYLRLHTWLSAVVERSDRMKYGKR